jgi:hypothetical protein
VSWAEVVTPHDRETFRRCRRAWDLGSPRRRNLTPREPPAPSLEEAVREALAVYYYPGMWLWSRTLVEPRVLEAFETRCPAHERGVGVALLERSMAWAATADDFEPLQVNGEFDVTVPDPHRPRADLKTLDGVPLRYRGIVDLLAIDAAREYWIVRHRVAPRAAEPAALAIDPAGASACWAWGRCYLAQPVAGIVYNELCWDAPPGDERSPRVRRTRVRRGEVDQARAARTLGLELRDTLVPEVRIYPNFDWAHCRGCAFLRPCAAFENGADAEAILAADFCEGVAPQRRLGMTTWGLGRGAAPPPEGE